MKQCCVVLFGYNEYSKQILAKIEHLYHNVGIFVNDDHELLEGQKKGVRVEKFDLSDDWRVIEEEFDPDALVVFCALRDDAENVFLTISLRSSFEKMFIIALAQNNESMMKMKSAGADKVMPILQIAASEIADMLKKPIMTRVLDEILYEEGGLSIVEIEVGASSPLNGVYLHDIHFKRNFDLILLAVVDLAMGKTFSFAFKGLNHHIDAGDTLVVVGYKEKITRFKQWNEGI
jgi:voltage-gated potassium channel